MSDLVVPQDGDMGKAPAFQFYASDFLTGTSEMTSTEIGVYIRLLAFSWDKGPLPLEHWRLARMIGETVELFESMWPAVSTKWVKTDAGYINERLEQQRVERAEFAARQAERGRRSAETRTGTQRPRSRPVEPRPVEPDVNQGPLNSSVFDLQSSSVSKEQRHTETPAALMQAWNDGTTAPLPQCRELTPKREQSASKRLKEANLSEWETVIARIEASAFCRGGGSTGWIANFDWLLRPETRVKVLEGQYDRVVSAPKAGFQSMPQPAYLDDWFDECVRLHGNSCGGQSKHANRMEIDKMREAS